MYKHLFLLSLFMLNFLSVKGQHKSTMLDSIVQHQLIENGFTGNILIAESGNIIYQKSVGFLNIADSIPMSEDAIFELASVSKQFTAAGILLLQKEGLLAYDDDIRKYIPELKAYPFISIRNLLNHTSGLPDYLAEGMDSLFSFEPNSFITNQDVIEAFAVHLPALRFSPNTQFEYSNTGYVLLASIIESVSKQSFGDFLASKLFQPLGMKHTFVHRRRYQPRSIDNLALGYVYSNNLSKPILPDVHPEHDYIVPLDGIQGDGMVHSTIHDLLKWDRVLYTDQLFSTADKKEIFSPGILADGSQTMYGFGWGVDTFQNGSVLEHAGGWSGYITYFERHIKTDKTIIILQNNFDNYQFGIKEIRSVLYDLPIPPKKERQSIALTIDQLQSYEGVYQLDENTNMTLFVKEDVLLAQLTEQGAYPVYAEKKDYFYYEIVDAQLEFIKNKEGNIIRLILHQDGLQTPMVKLK